MNKNLAISLSLLLFCFLPIFILGENSWILLRDNLDSEFIYLHLLKQSNNLLSLNSSGTVPQVFNGLGVNYFHSEFSFIRFLFLLFPSFWAYIINSFLVRIIGIIGMHLLITTYFKDLKIPRALKILIPLSFGLLDIYSLYGLSVMGQPLLAWSFLNLKSNYKTYVSFIIVFLFPFYSHFAMTAPFILSALFIYGVGVFWVKKRISTNYLFGIALLFFSYILANYLTLQNFIFSDVVSHREEWHLESNSINKMITSFFYTAFMGQFHSSKIFGLPVLLLGGYIVLKRFNSYRTICLIILSLVVIFLFHSVYKNIAAQLENHLHILTSFNFGRFTFLLPFLLYLLLIKCFSWFSELKSLIIITATIFFLANLYFNNEVKLNVTQLILPKSTDKIITFSEFYSEDIFQKVAKYIDLPQENYKVVSLGIHPSIAQFNGFYTLDSYQNNYPLSYKMRFRKLIEGELNKSKKLKDYFDDWGSRCYLFSSELGETWYLNSNKTSKVSVNNLNINTIILKQMGANYILSVVTILNAKALKLNLERVFESNQSPYKIYLYRL